MGIEYYLFASYVFLLIAVLLVIGKRMFADVKRQKRMLDAKEKKLLRTFQTLEDAMDDFYDLVEESKKEFAEKRDKLDILVTDPSNVLHEITEVPKAAPKSAPLLEPKQPLANSVLPASNNFEQLFDQLAEKNPTPLYALHGKILSLANKGNTRSEIAKQLKITQTEVELVIGMNKGAEAAQ